MNCLQDSQIEESPLAHDYILEGCDTGTLIIFAHGAGANMHHEFMTHMTQRFVQQGFQVLRFNFLYMQANMADGKRRPPDRAPKLLTHFEQVLAHVHQLRLQGLINGQQTVLMGKSMGSRMAAMLCARDFTLSDDNAQVELQRVTKLVCLGYPFLPPKGKAPRLEAINENDMPILIIQGERDTFGTQAMVNEWSIRPLVTIKWLGDGDHSFKPRKSSGLTLAGNLDDAVTMIVKYTGESK